MTMLFRRVGFAASLLFAVWALPVSAQTYPRDMR